MAYIPGFNPNRAIHIGGLAGAEGGLLGAMNNPLLGLAAGLLSGRDPGGTFASGLNQGLVNMQGMQHAALQGSLLKAKLDEIEQAKKEREQWAATVGQAGTAPSPYQMSDAEMFPGEQQIPGLLNAGTEGTGLYKDDPQMAGLLSMLGPEQGRQFMAQATLKRMETPEDRTPADLLALQQAFGPDVGMQKWLEIKRPASNNTVINNIPKPDFGYQYIDPNNPAAGVRVVPGSPADAERTKAQAEKNAVYNTYETAMKSLEDALSATETGPIAGRVPAFTADQQTAEGAVAAMAPVLKQLFRSAGEGVFTDKDQQLLMEMIPKRTDLPDARRSKVASINAIVRAKLGMPSLPKNTAPQGGWSIEPAQ